MEKRIKLHDKTFKLFLPYSEIEAAIDQVAARINDDFRGCDDIPIILCVLNGSILFTAELMKRLDFDAQFLSVRLSSYQGTTSTGEVQELLGIREDIRGRRIIIVEDIVDTGTTMENLSALLKEKGAAEVRICTMLLKPEVYHKPLRLDYVAKEIPNHFIVGFGLDYDELGRNYKDIYVLDK